MNSVQVQLVGTTDLSRALEAVRRAPPRAFVTISDGPPRPRQLKAYWAILREIAEGAYVDGRKRSTQEWHKAFAGTLIGFTEEEWPNNVRQLVPMSINSLSWREFADYVLQIEALIMEFSPGFEFQDARRHLVEFREQVR